MMRRLTTQHGAPADEALLLLDDGWNAERIANALSIDAETVRRPPAVSGVRRRRAQRLGYKAPHATSARSSLRRWNGTRRTSLYDGESGVCLCERSLGWTTRRTPWPNC